MQTQTATKTITVFLIGAFVGGMAAWLWISGDIARISDKKDDTGKTDIIETTNTFLYNNAITVSDQAPGIFVTVEDVSLSETTWIAISEDQNGAPGTILGARLFDAGTYKDVTVELLRGTEDGGVYYAVLHNEDGDRAFNVRKDTPIYTVSNDFIMAVFNVKIPSE